MKIRSDYSKLATRFAEDMSQQRGWRFAVVPLQACGSELRRSLVVTRPDGRSTTDSRFIMGEISSWLQDFRVEATTPTVVNVMNELATKHQ